MVLPRSGVSIMRRFSLLVALFPQSGHVLADISFISPRAEDTFYANNSITITFKESNNVPLISDFQEYSILLGYSNDTKTVCKKPDSHSLSSPK